MNELCFTMLGSSGAGKTTLLACMNKYFSEVFSGFFVPGDNKTREVLKEAYELLEAEANSDSSVKFSSPLPNTEEFHEYLFDIKGRNARLRVRFFDFPGGWLSCSVEEANYKKLSELVNRSDVVFITVSTPYLFEYKGEFAERAKIKEIQNLLSKALTKPLTRDKLIIVVPTKCEAYIKDDKEKLYAKLEEHFADTIKLAKNDDKIALVFLPVKTVGNANFSRFEFKEGQDREIEREVFKKIANSKFAPENIDQPLRFAISFFLNHFNLSQEQDLKGLRDEIQKGLKIDEAKIISGFGLINGDAIINPMPLEGNKKIEGTETETELKDDKPIKIKKKGNKYKIAVMGATGVGKTVFLGSYFYLAAIDAKTKYSIEPASQDVAERMTLLSTQLIKDKINTTGTSERGDFSFNVASLDMNVELYDIQGSTTTDIDAWVRENIMPDLLNADGALFFISGYDLVNNPDKTWQDTMVFQKAISLLRSNVDKSLVGRADIPIYFIITKGDTIPDVSPEDLRKRVQALIKRASSSPEEAGLVEKVFGRKGKNVKLYKTEAMGKYQSLTVLPENYSPVNVAEPMDALLHAMYKARKTNKKVKKWIYITAAAFIIGALYFGLYKWDHSSWDKVKDNIRAALRKADYASVQQMIENFKSPSVMGLYLKFLRADNNINEGYILYESALYDLIKPDIENINENNLPPATKEFLDAADRIDKYLAVKHFASAAPEHYAQVNSKKWYFDMGRLFYINLNDASRSPDDLLKIILQCLNQEYPEAWSSRVNARIDSAVRAFTQSLTADKVPDNIAKIDLLLAKTNLPASSRSELEAKRAVFTENLDNFYKNLVREWLASYREYDDIMRIKSLMSAQPNMTEGAKQELINGINEKAAASLARSRTHEELVRDVDKISRFGVNVKSEIILNSINLTAQELVKKPLNELRGKLSGYLADDRYDQAKKDVMTDIETLRGGIMPLVRLTQDESLIPAIEKTEQTMFDEIQAKHLNFCRQKFNRYRNTANPREINECIEHLNKFISLWPQSSESKDVAQVLAFLNTIRGGIQGTLEVVEGDFSDIDTWDTPDTFVIVSNNNQQEFLLRTKVVDNDRHPKFGVRKSYNWQINSVPLIFSVFDAETVGSPRSLLTQEVNLSGFFGFENLNGKLQKSAGCWLSIKFEHAALPACPWR